MNPWAFGEVWEFGDGKICSRFFEIFCDSLSFEGICGAVVHLVPPSQNRIKSCCLPLKRFYSTFHL